MTRSLHPPITASRGLGERNFSRSPHGLAITAIEREGDPHPLTVAATDLKAVGAPAAVALIDDDACASLRISASSVFLPSSRRRMRVESAQSVRQRASRC
jgi:hypothetical protein